MIEKFIEDYSDRAFQFAYSLCGSVEEAKELVQEAFFRVIRKWDQYDRSQPLESWFLTILRNVYYDSLKRYERKNGVPLDETVELAGGERVELTDNLADANETPILDRLVREEADAEVRAAIATLSPEHRAIIDLADIQGLGYDRIAEVLDCPAGTVRSRLWRARSALREALVARGAEAAR